MENFILNKLCLLLLCLLIVSTVNTCTDTNCNNCAGDPTICQSCNPNFYKNTQNSCSPCIQGCATCTDSSSCQRCQAGYGLVNGQCAICGLTSFSDGTTGCAPCSTGCNICQSASLCTSCATYYYLYSGSCLTVCPSGYITSQNPNICYICDQSCFSCNGPASNQCISCKGTSSLTPSGTCSTCPQSFYSSNNICMPCPNGCIYCASATNCQKSGCPAGQTFLNGGCQQCSSGKGSVAGYVGACTVTCGTNCLNCAAGASNAQTCLQSNCLAGYYLDSTNTCVMCTGGKGSQAGGIGSSSCSVSCGSSDCTACGISPSGFKTCIASSCIAGSYFDSLAGKCLACAGGKGSAANSLVCSVNCTVSNCLNCNENTGNCLNCLAGYYFNSGSCQICSTGGSKVGSTSCGQTCPTGCTACSYSSSGFQACLTSACTAGSYFDNIQQKCVQCSGGFGSKAGALSCSISCYSGCSACSIDSSNAPTCLISTCPAGTYADDSLKKCTNCASNQGSAANSLGSASCFPCDSSCSSCSVTNSASNCLSCISSVYYLQSGTCLSKCSSDFQQDTSLKICYKCNSNCLTCNHASTSVCLTCASGLYLNPLTQTCVVSCPKNYYPKDSTCLQCPNGCSFCQYQLSSKSVACTTCNTGFHIQSATCQPCNPACTACNSATECTACASNYFLTQTTCYRECLRGYIAQAGSSICKPCSTGCSACVQSYGLSSGSCVACDRASGSSSDGTAECGPCLTNCIACQNGYFLNTGSYNCKKCPFGSVAKGSPSSCTICPNGMVPNSDSSECVPCTTSCSVCVAGFQLATDGTCTRCSNGKISTFGGVCSLCPSNKISSSDNTKCISCTRQGQIPNSDQSTCVPCVFNCVVCPINYGYSSVDNSCTFCGLSAVSDGTKLCTPCSPGQLTGSTGVCMNCQTNCQLCAPGYGYNSITQVCVKCPTGYYSPGGTFACQFCPTSSPQIPNDDQSSCVDCPQGYIVSFDLTTCNLCKTSCSICPPNYGLNNGGVTTGTCTLCTPGLSSTGSQACRACTVGGCSSCPQNAAVCTICLPTYFASSTGATCSPCLTATTFDQCSQSSCSGFIFYNGTCIKNCSVIIKNTNNTAPVNGSCSCPTGTIWITSSNSTTCRSCSDISITKQQCTSVQCRYLWANVGGYSFCTSCALLGGTVGPNGTCKCGSGYYWDAASNYCMDCGFAPPSSCGTVSSCPLYYLDAALNCQPCSSTTAVRTAITPQTECPCVSGFVWSIPNTTCVKSSCTATQFYSGGICNNCPTLNVLQASKKPVGNGTVCVCVKNYQFYAVGSTFGCYCNNAAGLFDKGNQAGCVTCSSIAGAIAFDSSSNQCTCISGSVWNSSISQCQCSSSNYFFKFGTMCVSCADPTVNGATVNPSDPTSCTCPTNFVWSASLAQCICKTAGQFMCTACKKPGCTACDKATSTGAIVTYNKCQCKTNQIWDPTLQICKCDSNSILIKADCVSCLSVTFGGPPSSASACSCTSSDWQWSSTKNACLCKTGVTCDCSSIKNTFFYSKNGTCVACNSLDSNALAAWPSGQTQCTCNSIKYAFNPATGLCECTNTANSNVILISKACVLCDHSINAISAIKSLAQSCACFPNYQWTATKFNCALNTKTIGTMNIFTYQTEAGAYKTCSSMFAKAVSVSGLDNFNCLCAARNTIYNDITGQCVTCSSGSLNGVTCKCPTGQGWSILMMSCISLSPPGGVYTNPSYAKCIQPYGLASSSIIAFSPSDSNQVFVSGELEFAALANLSPLYAAFSGFKCDCANGFGWNPFRKRCYPTSLNNAY